MNLSRRSLFSLLVTAISALPATAANLLVSQGVGMAQTGSDANFYGGSEWTHITADINAKFDSVTVVPNLNDLGQLMSHDRLWIDQRYVGGVLSATEISNIQQFIATGRRLVMMGENNAWTAWNKQILGLVGGAYSGQAGNDIVTALPTVPPLTSGVGPISFVQNSYGLASGGTALFSRNWATLWNNHALTVLDVNIFHSGGYPSHDQFSKNVVAWLAVPEPSGFVLCAVALSLLACRRRAPLASYKR